MSDIPFSPDDPRCPVCGGDPCFCYMLPTPEPTPEPSPEPLPQPAPETPETPVAKLRAGDKVRGGGGRKYILKKDVPVDDIGGPEGGHQKNPHIAYACPDETCHISQRAANNGRIVIVRLTTGTYERIGASAPQCGFCGRMVEPFSGSNRKKQ